MGKLCPWLHTALCACTEPVQQSIDLCSSLSLPRLKLCMVGPDWLPVTVGPRFHQWSFNHPGQLVVQVISPAAHHRMSASWEPCHIPSPRTPQSLPSCPFLGPEIRGYLFLPPNHRGAHAAEMLWGAPCSSEAPPHTQGEYWIFLFLGAFSLLRTSPFTPNYRS